MSQENVDLITGLQLGPDVDVATLMRDDATWEAMVGAIAPLMHPDFECIAVTKIEGEQRYRGLAGLRTLWLDWLEPWESYRTVIDDVIDVGDDVVVVVRDFGRRAGVSTEIGLQGATIWTVIDKKVSRAQFFASREQALEAVGLAE